MFFVFDILLYECFLYIPVRLRLFSVISSGFLCFFASVFMHEVILLLRIDFIKDFHRVNLWKLFNKLLDDKLHRDITAAGSSLALGYFSSWFNVCIVSFLVA